MLLPGSLPFRRSVNLAPPLGCQGVHMMLVNAPKFHRFFFVKSFLQILLQMLFLWDAHPILVTCQAKRPCQLCHPTY